MPTKRTHLLPLLILLLLSLGFACTSRPSAGAEQGDYRVVRDMLDREVKVPQHSARIVGLGAGAVRLLVYLEASERLSGVEEMERRPGRPYWHAQEHLRALPQVGPSHGGDPELLAHNAPDLLVFSNASRQEAERLQALTKIPVLALTPGNLLQGREQFNQAVTLLADVLGKQERGDRLLSFIDQQIGELQALVDKQTPTQGPSVYLGGVSFSGARGLSSTLPEYEAFTWLGLQQPATALVQNKATRSNRALSIDPEQLLVWQPDYLFIDAAGLHLSQEDLRPEAPLPQLLSAFAKDRVHTFMPHNFYATNYENLLINAWFTASVVFPERLSQGDFEQRRAEIYRFFLGTDVSEDLLQIYPAWQKLKH
ncbi:ABC transporter substrate-binding protein [Geofilum rhodophaeum]|uniref:ABC transporter substrate-binding protein n=1 Tax=Geofilum rhodophaeum TaxID=1965019 RepID=UPI001314B7A8|nr:ABC transporter substrate-binding protein [Geofilum rhodophaeum]